MEPSLGMAGLVVGILGLLLIHVIRSPKETHAEYRRRMDLIEAAHDDLAIRFVESSTRLAEKIGFLGTTMAEMNIQLKELAKAILDQRRGNR